MPIQRETKAFIERAINFLMDLSSQAASGVGDLSAMLRLSDLADDATARAIVEKVRETIRLSLEAFEATDFKTAPLPEDVLAEEPLGEVVKP